MSKDLLADRYGRFYEIPAYLQRSGHEVKAVSLSYYPGIDIYETGEHEVDWTDIYIGRNAPAGIIRHYYRLSSIIQTYRPDILVAVSDSLHLILASRLAKKHRLPYVVDLYDNFESYRSSLIPGIKAALAIAVRSADGISVVSNHLKKYIEQKYNPGCHIDVIENAVKDGAFLQYDKYEARKKLDLPHDGLLIGTAGSLAEYRGISTLISAYHKLTESFDNIYLILAGPAADKNIDQGSGNILYIGELAHEKIPDLFNALDVGIICNRRNPFSLYCFPQKAVEMLACNLPIVSADVGPMSDLLSGYPSCLYQPDDVDSLVSAIKAQIENPVRPHIEVHTWSDQGRRFDDLIRSVVS